MKRLAFLTPPTLDEEHTCPVCHNPLEDDWHGVAACFCRFNGRSPSAQEVIDSAEAYERRN